MAIPKGWGAVDGRGKESRVLVQVLFAPSIPWLPDRSSFVAGAGPDPFKLYGMLEKHGISSRVVDPYPRPLNPFSTRNTLLQSIDPLRALRIGLRDRDVDVVVSVFEGAAASLGAMKSLLRLEAAIAMWDIGLTEWRLRNKIINFTLPRIDQLYVLGSNQVDHIQKQYARCRKISAIGHYVDTDFFTPRPVPEGGCILSVGDDIGRDFSTLVQATEAIDREVIIKASRHPPDATRQGLRVIRDRISYVALRELYWSSAVVVLPTRVTHNACGVSTLLEAAACGRPMVVSDNPGIRDFFVPDETCLVVPPHDAEALESAIRRLLGDVALRQRLAANARAFVEQNFTSDAFADRMAGALRCIGRTH